MKVFKFGGGVLNSAEAVKKIPGIIGLYPGEPLVIVVSAFGKTTNALEGLINARTRRKKQTRELFDSIVDYHTDIQKSLFPSPFHPVYEATRALWIELDRILGNDLPMLQAEFYDQVICYGELVSSTIVSRYLSECGLDSQWFDIRTVIKTDSNHRDASVDWTASGAKAEELLAPLLKKKGTKRPLVVTQGFIGSDSNGHSTSLGREGSDYTAAVMAALLEGDEVITWKDVSGVLNADPKHFRQTVKLDHISYAEATELAYYGAKVLHPKTIKPLRNRKIPLQVRSFSDPELPGTLIQDGTGLESSVPSFIFKFDQVLFTVSSYEFSFIDEKVFTDVFAMLTRYSMHVNIIQNSALTLSFCIDNHPQLKWLIARLQKHYVVKYNSGLELITIRHSNEKASELVLRGKQVLLEQHNRTVAQYVVR